GTGRFLQQDSVLGTPAQPRTLHRYAYSFNNPVNYTDPSGHMPPGRYGGGGNGGGRSAGSIGGASVPGPGAFSPGRSANGAAWSTHSDSIAKTQSQGFRPSLCSLGQRLVEGFNNFYTDINDLVLDPIRDSIEVLQNSELGQQASQKLDDLRQWATANPKLAAGIALAAAGAIVV
ncbi:MAG: hypothetical protein GY803_26070, partial [Chloroflexi bacterium]|nr:hypothetical protein [Chloroflexota bacterium]